MRTDAKKTNNFFLFAPLPLLPFAFVLVPKTVRWTSSDLPG